MNLKTVRIENFRSFKDETIILDNYTCMVGTNGSGKSTLLMALNVFFRNNIANADLLVMTKADFHNEDTSCPIRITLTFENLNEAEQEELKDYYRQGKLIVTAKAIWDEEQKAAPVKQHGLRKGIASFAQFFAKYGDNEKKDVLKAVYLQLMETYGDLPAPGTKDAMYEALRSYESEHESEQSEIESQDEFYGFRGTGKLSKFLQWVYVPAVKDVASEQEENKKTALGQLLERTVRSKVDFSERISKLKEEIRVKYEQIVSDEKDALNGLANSLTARLQEWSTPKAKVDLNWNYDKDKTVSISSPLAKASIGDDGFIGEITRLGHGMQRAFLITLLQELASLADGDDIPELILGLEEPELYQHPPQARHMQAVLEKLAAQQGNQVIVTTHSPYFVPGKGFQNVRIAIKRPGTFDTKVKQVTEKQLEEMLAAALYEQPKKPSARIAAIEQIMRPSLKEIFFAKNIILVEGTEDIAFISTYIDLLGLSNALRMNEAHFVIVDGKVNMSRPLAIADAFGLNVFAIFDGDLKEKEGTGAANLKNNSCLLKLAGENARPDSESIIWGHRIIMWPTNFLEVVKADYGDAAWNAACDKVRDMNAWHGVSKKNKLLIAATVEELWLGGGRSDSLEKACKKIIEFSKRIVVPAAVSQ